MDTQWHELTASALKKKCEERGLPKSGVKVDLLNRLREHDEKYRPQPEQDPAPLRRHSDHYRPQYDDRGQGSSPGNVPRDLSTMRQQPAGDVRIDRRQSTLTEGELEQICRDNYLPYESDRAGTGRKTEILTEYNLKAEETKKKRDAAISKVETKYKNEMAKLDKDKKEKLDQLDREIAPKLEKQRIWGPAFAQLQMLRSGRGVKTVPYDFAPSYLGSPSMSSPLPSRPRPNSDQMSVASSSTSTRSPAFFSLKRKASDTTLASSSTGAPALRVRDREDPFVDPPRGPRADMVVEPEPIRGQLTDNPHIFIPESNIWFRQGNLHRMKTMIENAQFFPKHVRADKTGYFIVFESCVQGDSQAALCFEHFQGREFRGIPMRMELNRRGR